MLAKMALSLTVTSTFRTSPAAELKSQANAAAPSSGAPLGTKLALARLPARKWLYRVPPR